MSLGADLVATLPFLREQAESMMLTVGTVKRANGTTVIDPETYEESPGYDIVHTGICRLKFGDTSPAGGAVPGAVVTDQRATLSFPIDGSGDIRTGDIWECTENPMDASLVGRTLRIAGVHAQTLATARRFSAEETS